MKIILVIIFAFLKTAYARKCYTCSSDSDEACTDKQTEQTCTDEEECVTLKYTTILNQKRVYKFCQNKKFYCNKECSAPWTAGHKSCKALCCDLDYCNRPTVVKKAIGNRRSTNDEIRNGASTPPHITYTATYVVFLLLLVTWIR